MINEGSKKENGIKKGDKELRRMRKGEKKEKKTTNKQIINFKQ